MDALFQFMNTLFEFTTQKKNPLFMGMAWCNLYKGFIKENYMGRITPLECPWW